MAKAAMYNQQYFQLTRKQLAQFVNAVQDFLGLEQIKGGVIVEATPGKLVTNIHHWMSSRREWTDLLQEISIIIRDWRRAIKVQRDAITRAVNKLKGLRLISFSERTRTQERRPRSRSKGRRPLREVPYRRQPKHKHRLAWQV